MVPKEGWKDPRELQAGMEMPMEASSPALELSLSFSNPNLLRITDAHTVFSFL